MKLNAKQRQFCHEYMTDMNAAQSAIRAGYSKKYAKETGYENLTKPHIQEFLGKLLSDREKRTEITADYVLRNLREIADDAKQEKEYTHAVKSFELLGKHLKLFTDRVEQDIKAEVATVERSIID